MQVALPTTNSLCNVMRPWYSMHVYMFSYIEVVKWKLDIIESLHEIFNSVVCATSNASDHPAHTRSLFRAFASRLSIL